MSDFGDFDGDEEDEARQHKLRRRGRNLRRRRRERRDDRFLSQFVGAYGVLAGAAALFVCVIGWTVLWILFIEGATRQ